MRRWLDHKPLCWGVFLHFDREDWPLCHSKEYMWLERNCTKNSLCSFIQIRISAYPTMCRIPSCFSSKSWTLWLLQWTRPKLPQLQVFIQSSKKRSKKIFIVQNLAPNIYYFWNWSSVLFDWYFSPLLFQYSPGLLLPYLSLYTWYLQKWQKPQAVSFRTCKIKKSLCSELCIDVPSEVHPQLVWGT